MSERDMKKEVLGKPTEEWLSEYDNDTTIWKMRNGLEKRTFFPLSGLVPILESLR